MRKALVAIAGVALFAGCLPGGCGQKGVTERVKEEVAPSQEIDVNNYKLTDQDVKLLLANWDEIEKIFREANIDLRKSKNPGEVLEVASARVNSRLRELGFEPPERFYAVLGSVMAAYLTTEMAEAFGGDLENIDDPVLKHNVEVIKKFRKEINETFNK